MTRTTKQPLVDVDPRRVRAAMEAEGWTWSNLATRMAELSGGKPENRQTLHELGRGDALKRCQQARLEQLSLALDVPSEWLAGHEVTLPFMSALFMGHLSQVAPRVALATLRLLRRAGERCAQDLGAPPRHAARARRKSTKPLIAGDAETDVLQALHWALAQLCDAENWRARILRRDDSPPVPYTTPTEPPRAPWDTDPLPWPRERVEASLGLVRALTYWLEPWLDGRASLNYQKLSALVAFVVPVFHANIRNAPPPDVPFTRSEGPPFRRYVSDPGSPFALLPWPESIAASPSTTPPDAELSV